ncbi:MAG TPA: zf-HC2 domain-containing protein [Candidatus Nitrosotalea sp.]|nr:zf-HC2 domain-containing protein [Candidatus Nitrosotalea sp.]
MNETHPSLDQIVDHIHGELPAADEAAMHAHLAGCRQCDERRNEEAAITKALRAHALATELELPPALVARIRAEVANAAQPSWRERLQLFFRPIVLLPVAAAAALVIYLRISAGHGAVSPTPIDAAYYVNEHSALAVKAPFADNVPPATLTLDDEAH